MPSRPTPTPSTAAVPVWSHPRAVWTMVLVTLLWSIAGVVSRQLTQADGFEVTFWRSSFTALALLVLLPLTRGREALTRLPWGSPAFWLSGACWAAMFTTYMVALTMTGVARVLVTMALAPLMTALLSRWITGQRLPARTWIAIAVAGAGLAYMFAGQLGGNAGWRDWLGSIVALGVPLTSALNWSVLRRIELRGETLDLVPAVLLGAALSALATLPFALPFTASGTDIGWLALLGVVQLAIPSALAVGCARALPAPEVALLDLLEVIFGIALVWLIAGEAPRPEVLAGGTLVIGALLVNEWLGWRQRDASHMPSTDLPGKGGIGPA